MALEREKEIRADMKQLAASEALVSALESSRIYTARAHFFSILFTYPFPSVSLF